MTNYKNYIVTAIIALVVSLVVIAVYPKSQSNVSVDTFGGLSERDINAQSLVVSKFKVNQYGGTTLGGDVLTVTPAANASSTVTVNTTLTEAQMIKNSIIVVADTNTGLNSLTLPATSTMKTLLASAGTSRSWLIQSKNTTAAITTTVLAGTGIDLQGDAAGDDALNGGVYGVLTCYRLPTTDVMCKIIETVVAD